MKRIEGVFDLKTGMWEGHAQNVYTAKYGSCTCEWIGFPRTLEDATAPDAIAMTFATTERPTANLKGVYLAIVYDSTKKMLQIYQDRSTSPLALYHTTVDGKLYYSTSLKRLLRESQIPRVLDNTAVQEYLINGYIWGSSTLVHGVQKLAPFEWLVVTTSGVESNRAEYPFVALSEAEGIAHWRSSLDRAILESAQGAERLCTALSSGYDSNYILHVLHRDTDFPIDCFSVGGKFGKNELPQVKENARQYPRVTLHTALTDSNTLSTLPDLVWRLEGAVYEVGNFLQYELNHTLAESGIHRIICGECADQVMQEWYLTEDRIGTLPPKTYYEFDRYPFVYGHSVILKKNGILGNSFDIESAYPFLDTDFVNAAQALRKVNMTDKRYHVRICRELLDPAILNNITKIGGATEVHSLFDSREDANKLLAKVRASALYQTYGTTCTYGGYPRRQLENEANCLKSKVRNGLFSLLHINTSAREQGRYYLEEMALREAFCYLSVILFERLILSGEYDRMFDEPGISATLAEFGF